MMTPLVYRFGSFGLRYSVGVEARSAGLVSRALSFGFDLHCLIT